MIGRYAKRSPMHDLLYEIKRAVKRKELLAKIKDFFMMTDKDCIDLDNYLDDLKTILVK